jgi:hypothetical protein
MLNSLKENNYLFIPNFLSQEDTDRIYTEFIYSVKTYPDAFNITDKQAMGSPSIYNFVPFLELLCEKVSFLNEAVGEKLLPTYTYGRLYKHGSVLEKHTDRPACEISVTAHLGGDGTKWPIWFTKPDGTTVSYNLSPGQAVIYLGCESKHWRDKFLGDTYGQVFLHYVRSRGPNADHTFDTINKFGLSN